MTRVARIGALGIMVIAATIAVFPSAAYSATDPQTGVLFYASMDGSYEAKALGRGLPIEVTKKPEFVPGKRGMALRTSPDIGHLTYESAGNINLDGTSVELWMGLDGWKFGVRGDGGDPFFHVFFECSDNRDWVVLYKYHENPSVYCVSGQRSKYSVIGHFPSPYWQSGEWHHLVYTWGMHGAKLYVDGNLTGSSKDVMLPKALPEKFFIGGRSWGMARWVTPEHKYGADLIDEVYIYGRALAAEEVAWAYEHSASRKAGEDVPASLTERLALQVKSFPSTNRCMLELAMMGAEQPLEAKATAVIDAGAAGKIEVTFPPFKGGVSRAEVNIPDIPGGEYPVEASLFNQDDKKVADAHSQISWPGEPAWRGNSIGLGHTVPKPFIPVARDGEAVSCWGRRYEIGKSGLPDRINTRGQDILASPITLIAKAGSTIGKDVQLVGEQMKLTAEHADAVEGQATGKLGELNWHCRMRMDFDGFIRYDVELVPTRPVRVSRLALRVPLRTDQGVFCYRYGEKVEALPSVGDYSRAYAFAPLFWVGDGDRGLAWCAESDEPFQNDEAKNVLRIRRQGEELYLEIAYIDVEKPINLKKPWSATFALMGSPVRPRDIDWHRYNFGGWKLGTDGAPVWIYWPNIKTYKYYGYPEMKDPAASMAEIAEARAKGTVVSPYFQTVMMSAGAPEYRQFGQEWGDPSIIDSYCSDIVAMGYPLIGVTCAASDLRDFLVWKNRDFMKRYQTDGIYYDHLCFFRFCKPQFGLGYIRNGQEQPAWDIFGRREAQKRLYTMARELNDKTFMMGHTAGNAALPFMAFVDANLNGEGLAVKDNYLDILSEAELRIQMAGGPWGPAPFWLITVYTDWQKSVAGTEHVISLLLLYDIGVWPSGFNTDRSLKYFTVLQEAGIQCEDGIAYEHIPYWRNSHIIGGQTDKVKCSFYRHPQKGVLLCATNLSREMQKVTLSIDWAKLTGKTTAPEVTDVWKGESVALDGKNVTIEVPPLNFRLLAVK